MNERSPEMIDLQSKLDSFDEPWVPKVVSELNGQYVKVAKFHGAYIWHHHEHEDEMFLVLEGQIKIHFRDRTVTLDAGQMIVVPRGVEHKPEAEQVAEVLLFEPKSVRNTGNVDDHGYTIEADDLQKI